MGSAFVRSFNLSEFLTDLLALVFYFLADDGSEAA